MLRFLPALLLLSSVAARAQIVADGTGDTYGGWKATPTYVGLIDVAASPLILYSLRAGSAAIAAAGTQKLINLRNGTTVETCDVLVATSGGLGLTANCSSTGNGQTVAAWLGAATGYFTKWYDQSGHGNDVSQATAANQPSLNQSCVNSLPCAVFAGSQYLTVALGAGVSQPFTWTGVFERTATFSVTQNIYSWGNPPLSAVQFYNSPNTGLFNIGGTSFSFTMSDSVWHSTQAIANAASSVVAVDGTTTSGTVASGPTPTATAIGTRGGGASNSFWGNLTEVAYWSGALSGNGSAVCHNERLYYGTGGSC